MSRTLASWREPGGKTTFVSAGKDASPNCSSEELAYWLLAGRINEHLSGSPATIAEIYHKVTRPMGLTSEDTIKLVKNAKKWGYLKCP